MPEYRECLILWDWNTIVVIVGKNWSFLKSKFRKLFVNIPWKISWKMFLTISKKHFTANKFQNVSLLWVIFLNYVIVKKSSKNFRLEIMFLGRSVIADSKLWFRWQIFDSKNVSETNCNFRVGKPDWSPRKMSSIITTAKNPSPNCLSERSRLEISSFSKFWFPE